jgi:AraC-like DNA-binding protein
MEALSDAVCAASNDEERMDAANAYFCARIPEPDPRVAEASELVDLILQEPGIRTVDELVARSGLGKRTLQRIFNEYVGVSPKWVIRRYRLHELVEAIQAGDNPEWARLALDLGYCDQAHLIHDFKSITGVSPVQFRKEAARCSE